ENLAGAILAMNQSPQVPFLPDNAPFTAEQRAYLNGFLAGLFSRIPAGPTPSSPSPGNASSTSGRPALEQLTILFGSPTGTAETLARRLDKEGGKRGFVPTVHDLAKYPFAQLAGEHHLLVVTSTYGDGDPPDNAQAFWSLLSATTAPLLSSVRFS